MILVSAHQISKTFGARPLFSDLTFAVETGERIGLIGPNGAGKSTLLRILAQKTSVDSGKVAFQRGLKIGYLEQVPSLTPGKTIMATVLEGTSEDTSDFSHDWEHLALAHELLSKLELEPLGDTFPVEKLSGGWKKRVALARELIKKPDLLLLDEPTNHLDVESILWLETFLARAPFATLTITHDRAFLQKISNRIIELDPRHAGGLLSVQGDYAAYVEIRNQLISAQERRETILQNTLRRETEWLRRGAKARTTKQQARIQRAGDLKEEVEELTTRNLTRTARIEFQGVDKNPKKLIEAREISKSYGDRSLFSNHNMIISPGARIGLLGPNGTGKSSLIRVLVGLEEPTSGSVHRSEHLQVAYFEQNRETLDPNLTVLRTLCPTGETVEYRGTRIHIRGYLDRFLFTQGQMEMAVGKLSGGEQSRLLIARLMLRPANLLVLDEPTNDLDMATLSILEDCLTDFPGAVILVTHDRYFLDQVANQIWAFGPNQLIPFEGLSQWEEWRASENSRSALAAKSNKSAQSAPAPKSEASAPKKKKLGFKDQRDLDSMEANIHAAESRLARATQESTLPAHSSNSIKLGELAKEITEAQAELDRLYKRWAELEA